MTKLWPNTILDFCYHFIFRKLPVLIQGETSVGKTSLIQWLAKASGNHCVRINNHEHTDIQEYLGCYTSDENGKLVFKEGMSTLIIFSLFFWEHIFSQAIIKGLCTSHFSPVSSKSATVAFGNL